MKTHKHRIEKSRANLRRRWLIMCPCRGVVVRTHTWSDAMSMVSRGACCVSSSRYGVGR